MFFYRFRTDNGSCLSETCLLSGLLVVRKIQLMESISSVVRAYPIFVIIFVFFQVYHHASILLLTDYAYHYTPWPAIGVILGRNSFVHVFLYFYYGQSALYPTQKTTMEKIFDTAPNVSACCRHCALIIWLRSSWILQFQYILWFQYAGIIWKLLLPRLH